MDNLHINAKNGTLTRSNLADLLIDQSIDDEDNYGDTALTLAIRGGHVGAVKLLLQNRADANKATKDGNAPLYLAALTTTNSGRITQLLLDHDAEVDKQIPRSGDTALMAAVRQGTCPEAIRTLLDFGASLTKSNLNGETARSLADESTNSAVHQAIALEGSRPTVET
jgi:ankyrin repeat protein